MKVLMVNHHILPVGGTETYMHRVVANEGKQALEFAVAYASNNEERFSVEAEVVHLPGGAISPEVWSRLQGLKPDVVHFNNFPDRKLLAQLSELAPAVVFLHSHFPLACPGDAKFMRSQNRPCQRKVAPYCIAAPLWQHCGTRNVGKQWQNYLTSRRLLKGSHRQTIVVASEYMKEQLLINGVPTERIKVAPLGIPEGDFPAQPGNGLAPGVDFLFIGRLVAAKGASELLSALEFVEEPSTTVIVGDGPEKSALQQRAQALAPKHQVRFTGWLGEAEITKWLNQARCLVVPSVWEEPFGLVGLEAMRVGLAVVAYNRGGIGEWLSDGETGFLTLPDPRSLGRGLSQVQSDLDLATKLGAQGRKRFLEKFTLDHHLDQLRDIYRDVQEQG